MRKPRYRGRHTPTGPGLPIDGVPSRPRYPEVVMSTLRPVMALWISLQIVAESDDEFETAFHFMDALQRAKGAGTADAALPAYFGPDVELRRALFLYAFPVAITVRRRIEAPVAQERLARIT